MYGIGSAGYLKNPTFGLEAAGSHIPIRPQPRPKPIPRASWENYNDYDCTLGWNLDAEVIFL